MARSWNLHQINLLDGSVAEVSVLTGRIGDDVARAWANAKRRGLPEWLRPHRWPALPKQAKMPYVGGWSPDPTWQAVCGIPRDTWRTLTAARRLEHLTEHTP